MKWPMSPKSSDTALVQIRSDVRGTGAGTIWHPDGLIITNAHVVRSRNLQVTLADGRTSPARLLAHDESNDLTALSIDAGGLPTIDVGESTELEPGQLVMSLGHPWGVTGAATAGVVIGTSSEVEGLRSPGREWIVVDLHLRPGYSGGPLVDMQGRLVGINTIMNGPDVGMAVPAHVVKRFLRRSLDAQSAAACRGNRGRLSASPLPLFHQLLHRAKLPGRVHTAAVVAPRDLCHVDVAPGVNGDSVR